MHNRVLNGPAGGTPLSIVTTASFFPILLSGILFGNTWPDRSKQLYGKADVIAGVATGAIGIGMLVAEYLSLPFVYVRPEAKGHGRKNQIEGQDRGRPNCGGH